MKPIVKKALNGITAALTVTFLSAQVIADDIEIYQSSAATGPSVTPNLMFILDTSGSMDEPIDTPPDYDASFDYSALAGNCFDNDRMYVSTTAKIDSCSDEFKAVSFLKSQNQCLGAQEAFAVATGQGRGTGIYSSTWAQWNNDDSYWGLLRNDTDDNFYIECKADMDDHGLGQPQQKCINSTGTGNAFIACDADSIYSWPSIESESLTMYDGNWMNYQLYVTTNNITVGSNFLEVMKEAVRTVSLSVDDVGLGIMRFDGSWNHHGGSVSYPIQDSDAGRQNMLAQMGGWDHNGYTPLSETLYEAYLYYSGGRVDFGDGANPSTTGEAVTGSGNPKQYISPVDPDLAACQKQYIIMLSDGRPTRDTEADDKIEALPGFTSPGGTSTTCTANGNNGNGDCLDDLAGYMFTHGFDATLPDGDVIEDVKLATYTIGFGGDIPILSETARVGGGEYHIATSATDLLETFLNIISGIRDIHSTFSSPAVSVNAFNRTTHRSELYFTLFKPEVSPHWDGNFKRFKLDFDDLGIPSIVDQNDDPAVSNTTGFFEDDALSFWTATADAPLGDGRDTSLGGAASKFINGTPYAAGRKVYTDMGSDPVLSDNSNRVWRATSGVREAMGWDGDTSDTAQTDYYNKLVDWVRGIDVDDDDDDTETDDARRVMGDPLHAQPALIQYGGTDANPDITAYIATNDGLLHAIQTRTGVEQFAYIPRELLPRMDTLYRNSGSNKFYGLDGTVSPYIIDNDVDGIIEPGDGDKVYIFFGMRRGGSNIYAMDVTDRDNPELMWKILGGVDGNGDPVDNSLGDYSHLGQTWSRPSVRIVKLDGADVPVLIFAAGYDTAQDSVQVRTADSIGRGIYIVNAMTGEPLWRMGPDGAADLTDTNMQYSIPSDVSAVDTDGDGYVDHLYVGDMGGQLWRVDINNAVSSTSSNLVVSGGRIADLADNTVATNRRFYYSPSVAISKDANDDIFTALVISSGYRAHPNNRNIQDRVFMIRDLPVNGRPTSYQTVVVNNSTEDLYNATANLIGQGTTAQQTAARASLTGADGWYMNLDASAGEKSITKALIFAGEIFLTSYEPYDPATASSTSCEPQVGNGYLYHIHLEDAQPVKNYDTVVDADPDNLTVEDRRVQLARSGIPADPSIITTEDGSARCVGTECDRLESAGKHKTIYWFEE